VKVTPVWIALLDDAATRSSTFGEHVLAAVLAYCRSRSPVEQLSTWPQRAALAGAQRVARALVASVCALCITEVSCSASCRSGELGDRVLTFVDCCVDVSIVTWSCKILAIWLGSSLGALTCLPSRAAAQFGVETSGRRSPPSARRWSRLQSASLLGVPTPASG